MYVLKYSNFALNENVSIVYFDAEYFYIILNSLQVIQIEWSVIGSYWFLSLSELFPICVTHNLPPNF
jgi:hypothetical protein